MALMLAARRGVLVDLVMPARSNHPLADVARYRPLRDLANAGARVWFVPWMEHAKAIVFDEQLALAGSANLDLRSLFLNYELMLAFYEPADVKRFAAWIEGERQHAVRFQAREPGLARDLLEGLLLWLAFQL
jgi:cardiolipin synthase